MKCNAPESASESTREQIAGEEPFRAPAVRVGHAKDGGRVLGLADDLHANGNALGADAGGHTDHRAPVEKVPGQGILHQYAQGIGDPVLSERHAPGEVMLGRHMGHGQGWCQ